VRAADPVVADLDAEHALIDRRRDVTFWPGMRNWRIWRLSSGPPLRTTPTWPAS
jgi:hypothetical protein